MHITLMMAAAASLSWSDLPPELLGLLKRLPSLADRVRLRAVCQPWHSNARLQSLPPPLPWLTLLDGTFLSIPDDSWLFLMQIDGGCSLMNPFSKATLDLPNLAALWCSDWCNEGAGFNPLFYKLVVPSPLDSSPESLVAVLILDDGRFGTVCICHPPVATNFTLGKRAESTLYLVDVAFFNGKLYGLDFRNKLVIFEIGYDLGSKPKISATECIINSGDLWDLPHSLSTEDVYPLKEYLVECCGKLLRVVRFIHRPSSTSFSIKHDRTVAFDVIEADLSTNPGQWRWINKLDGQALFVGRHCSKSFAAEQYNGIQEDCIYFMSDYDWPDCVADPLGDSGVYNLRNGSVTPLLSQTATVPQHHGGQWRPTWFFPAGSIV
ncbi:unnamed protein product [Urochloa decumbens]|uniref:KIB1-4 beta-propeller domain-containing protein n=1 Tax=Urochloa decumbens TaxID=240449 RepID=A0ABC8ZQY1_9POAL